MGGHSLASGSKLQGIDYVSNPRVGARQAFAASLPVAWNEVIPPPSHTGPRPASSAATTVLLAVASS